MLHVRYACAACTTRLFTSFGRHSCSLGPPAGLPARPPAWRPTLTACLRCRSPPVRASRGGAATRRMLYRSTMGRLRNPDAVYKTSEGRVEGLRSKVEEFANESKKLQVRAVRAVGGRSREGQTVGPADGAAPA